MSRNRSVSGGTRQVLSLSVGDVLSVGILVALCESEVNDENLILSCVGGADKEVIWLDIPVDDPLFVHLLNELNHLNRNQEHSLERELAFAHLEKVLK